jgi:uncharacterized membrane protein
MSIAGARVALTTGMGRIAFGAALAALLAGLRAAPASAQEHPAAGLTASTPLVEPVRAAPAPPSAGAAQVRELNERLFGAEALRWSTDGVTRNGGRLDAPSLYQVAGRTDLLERYRSRRTLKRVMIGGGLAALTLGTIVGLSDSCICERIGSHEAADVFVETALIAGALTTLIGLVMPADPLSNDEKYAVVQEYNGRLRAQPGLSF